MRDHNRLEPYATRPIGIAALGALVVVLWGLSCWLRLLAGALPPLELTAIALGSAAAFSALLPGARGALRSARCDHPWYAWLAIAGGLTGGAAFYFAALDYAPAAQVVVITYTWPLLFAIASDVCRGRRPAPATLAALLMGLAGVAIMQGPAQTPDPQAWLGYAGGLMSGLCWVGYSLFVQQYARPVGAAYPVFLVAAALASLLLQVVFGDLVWPIAPRAATAAFVLGIGPYGLGFLAWGHVIRHGNPRVVPVLPYAVPGVAAVALVLVGRAQSTPQLWAGCLVVLTACGLIVTRNARPGQPA